MQERMFEATVQNVFAGLPNARVVEVLGTIAKVEFSLPAGTTQQVEFVDSRYTFVPAEDANS